MTEEPFGRNWRKVARNTIIVGGISFLVIALVVFVPWGLYARDHQIEADRSARQKVYEDCKALRDSILVIGNVTAIGCIMTSEHDVFTTYTLNNTVTIPISRGTYSFAHLNNVVEVRYNKYITTRSSLQQEYYSWENGFDVTLLQSHDCVPP